METGSDLPHVAVMPKVETYSGLHVASVVVAGRLLALHRSVVIGRVAALRYDTIR